MSLRRFVSCKDFPLPAIFLRSSIPCRQENRRSNNISSLPCGNTAVLPRALLMRLFAVKLPPQVLTSKQRKNMKKCAAAALRVIRPGLTDAPRCISIKNPEVGDVNAVHIPQRPIKSIRTKRHGCKTVLQTLALTRRDRSAIRPRTAASDIHALRRRCARRPRRRHRMR